MAKVSVNFMVEVPDGIDEEQVYNWIRFELHDIGILAGDNPLSDTELEPIFGTLEVNFN